MTTDDCEWKFGRIHEPSGRAKLCWIGGADILDEDKIGLSYSNTPLHPAPKASFEFRARTPCLVMFRFLFGDPRPRGRGRALPRGSKPRARAPPPHRFL